MAIAVLGAQGDEELARRGDTRIVGHAVEERSAAFPDGYQVGTEGGAYFVRREGSNHQAQCAVGVEVAEGTGVAVAAGVAVGFGVDVALGVAVATGVEVAAGRAVMPGPLVGLTLR